MSDELVGGTQLPPRNQQQQQQHPQQQGGQQQQQGGQQQYSQQQHQGGQQQQHSQQQQQGGQQQQHQGGQQQYRQGGQQQQQQGHFSQGNLSAQLTKSRKSKFSLDHLMDKSEIKNSILVVVLFIFLNSKMIWTQIGKAPLMGSVEPSLLALIINSIIAGIVFYLITTYLF